ncbi:hypothetical protein PR048_010678 [Dryococelus australis]|uniref:Uncharacterized protein n=1 Tax=Dryococelus australis TaxID=614101 RepID=A0ABQ9I3E7_9NEOP|nr:hypothetical protein PR048_010678 [Dryococelus australis]
MLKEIAGVVSMLFNIGVEHLVERSAIHSINDIAIHPSARLPMHRVVLLAHRWQERSLAANVLEKFADAQCLSLRVLTSDSSVFLALWPKFRCEFNFAGSWCGKLGKRSAPSARNYQRTLEALADNILADESSTFLVCAFTQKFKTRKAWRRKPCTPVQSLARKSGGALDARVIVAPIAVPRNNEPINHTNEEVGRIENDRQETQEGSSRSTKTNYTKDMSDTKLSALKYAAVPTSSDRVRFPAGSPPTHPSDFRMWGSCRMMPLVGGFPRGSPVPPLPPPPLPFPRYSILSSLRPSPALKSSIQEASERYGRQLHARLVPRRSYAQGVQCFRRGPVLSKLDLQHRGIITRDESPQIKLRPTLMNGCTSWFETRSEIGCKIDTENCLHHSSSELDWRSRFRRLELSIRDQQPSSTNIKLEPGWELGSFDLGSGKMLVQPGIRDAQLSSFIIARFVPAQLEHLPVSWAAIGWRCFYFLAGRGGDDAGRADRLPSGRVAVGAPPFDGRRLAPSAVTGPASLPCSQQRRAIVRRPAAEMAPTSHTARVSRFRDIPLDQYQLGCPLVDDRPIMNTVKYRVVSGVQSRTELPRSPKFTTTALSHQPVGPRAGIGIIPAAPEPGGCAIRHLGTRRVADSRRSQAALVPSHTQMHLSFAGPQGAGAYPGEIAATSTTARRGYQQYYFAYWRGLCL